jgi:hypothetical protein
MKFKSDFKKKLTNDALNFDLYMYIQSKYTTYYMT